MTLLPTTPPLGIKTEHPVRSRTRETESPTLRNEMIPLGFFGASLANEDERATTLAATKSMFQYFILHVPLEALPTQSHDINPRRRPGQACVGGNRSSDTSWLKTCPRRAVGHGTQKRVNGVAWHPTSGGPRATTSMLAFRGSHHKIEWPNTYQTSFDSRASVMPKSLTHSLSLGARSGLGPILFTLSVASALAVCCVLPGQEQPAKVSRTETAKSLVQLLVDGKFDKAVADFDAVMLKVMPADQLKQTWEGVLADAGAYKKTLETRTETAGIYRVVHVTCEFAKRPLDVHVVFNKAWKISGLQFR